MLQEPNRLRLGEVTPAVVLQGLLAGCALDQRLSSEIENLYTGSILRYLGAIFTTINFQRMAGDATIGLEDLKSKVTELYKFRDHFFEENGLSEARGKAGQVGERKAALLEVLRVAEPKVRVEDRACFLYLKGRVQNISGEYSPEAEATLSKAVKLSPDLVDAWNELGECYMMKQVDSFD